MSGRAARPARQQARTQSGELIAPPARGSTAAPKPAASSKAPEAPRSSAPVAGRSSGPLFEGLGAWLDKFDYSLPLNSTIARMKRAGVRTLYLQTGTSKTGHPVDPRAARWLVAAHKAGMKVVGWYLPYYRNMRFDTNRTLAIARYRASGHRFDGLGVDIEARVVPRATFNRRVAAHMRAVRHRLGAKYPIAAVPPPPLQMRVAPGHWAGFPWKQIARESDAILLMSYWSVRSGCPRIPQHCAYGFTRGNVEITRRLIGNHRRDVAIHVIGGVGDATTTAQVEAFVRGAIDGRADGASFYDIATTRPWWWSSLARLQRLGT